MAASRHLWGRPHACEAGSAEVSRPVPPHKLLHTLSPQLANKPARQRAPPARATWSVRELTRRELTRRERQTLLASPAVKHLSNLRRIQLR